MACGTPVVAYDLPAYKGMLFSGVNGHVAKLGDVSELAGKASLALDNFKRLSREAIRTAKRFDWYLISKKYESRFLKLRDCKILKKTLKGFYIMFLSHRCEDFIWKVKYLMSS